MKVVISKNIADKLIEMLNAKYELSQNAKSMVNCFAENEEELDSAILVAFAYLGEEKANASTSCTTQETKTVQILNVSSKLLFVKAVKESCNYGLKEAKELADKLLYRRTENDYNFCSDNFSVGKDGIFTINEWENIVAMMESSEISWKYVEQ